MARRPTAPHQTRRREAHGASRRTRFPACYFLTSSAPAERALTNCSQSVRIPVNQIREAGRNTQGVKLVNLDPQDKLQAIAPVISEESADESTAPAA